MMGTITLILFIVGCVVSFFWLTKISATPMVERKDRWNVTYMALPEGIKPLQEFAFWLIIIFFVCLVFGLVWCLASYGTYINSFNTYVTLDKKINQIDQNSQTLIEESKKVLLQYPELEKSILTELKPETMIALGQTYPTLKSNESYNQIAALLKERMAEKEKLQTQKIDQEVDLRNASAWWWFASNWEEDSK